MLQARMISSLAQNKECQEKAWGCRKVPWAGHMRLGQRCVAGTQGSHRLITTGWGELQHD